MQARLSKAASDAVKKLLPASAENDLGSVCVHGQSKSGSTNINGQRLFITLILLIVHISTPVKHHLIPMNHFTD